MKFRLRAWSGSLSAETLSIANPQYFAIEKSGSQKAAALRCVKKASQSLPPTGGKEIGIIFCRGVYLAENTSQAASVEFVRLRRTNYARGSLQNPVKKPRRGFLTG